MQLRTETLGLIQKRIQVADFKGQVDGTRNEVAPIRELLASADAKQFQLQIADLQPRHFASLERTSHE